MELWFFNVSLDNSWNSAGNWFQDAGEETPNLAIPADGDVIYSGDTSTITVDTAVNPLSCDAACHVTSTISGGTWSKAISVANGGSIVGGTFTANLAIAAGGSLSGATINYTSIVTFAGGNYNLTNCTITGGGSSGPTLTPAAGVIVMNDGCTWDANTAFDTMSGGIFLGFILDGSGQWTGNYDGNLNNRANWDSFYPCDNAAYNATIDSTAFSFPTSGTCDAGIVTVGVGSQLNGGSYSGAIGCSGHLGGGTYTGSIIWLSNDSPHNMDVTGITLTADTGIVVTNGGNNTFVGTTFSPSSGTSFPGFFALSVATPTNYIEFTNYATYAGETTAKLETYPISYFMLAKFNPAEIVNMFLSDNNSNYGYFIYAAEASNGNVYFGLGDGVYASAIQPSDGLWHSYVVTIDGSANAKCYLDGIVVAAATGAITSTATGWYLGGMPGQSLYTNGNIAKAGIVARVLTFDEIAALAAGTAPASLTTSLFGIWLCDDADGTTIADSSGNDYDLAITGSGYRWHTTSGVFGAIGVGGGGQMNYL